MMNPFMLVALTAWAEAGTCVVKSSENDFAAYCKANEHNQAGCETYKVYCDWKTDSDNVTTTTPTTTSANDEDFICCTKMTSLSDHSLCAGADVEGDCHSDNCHWSNPKDCFPVALEDGPTEKTTKAPKQTTKAPKQTTKAPKTTKAAPTKPTKAPKTTTTKAPKTTKAAPTKPTKPTKPADTTKALSTTTSPDGCYPCSDQSPHCTDPNIVAELTKHSCVGTMWYLKGAVDECSAGCQRQEACAETCHKLDIKKCPCGEAPSTTTTTTTTSTTTVPVNDPVIQEVLDIIDRIQPDDKILIPGSKVYKKEDLINGVRIAMEEGVGDVKLFSFKDVTDDDSKSAIYAATGVAAFLAQAMKETIQYDACDENNWDSYQLNADPHSGKYKAASACGQLNQNYSGPAYQCKGDEAHMQCELDLEMEQVGVTHAGWYGAPPPFFCGPKSKLNETGVWDPQEGWCGAPPGISDPLPTTFDEVVDRLDAGGECNWYPGQLAGAFKDSVGKIDNVTTTGRSDVEGCCWWGRGVIQTTGICNFGKLNYFVGAKAKADKRPAVYGDIDFCKNPEAICNDPNYPSLKWFAGFFYWMTEVQTYDSSEYNYKQSVVKFVDGGFENPGEFIKHISAIVNRGCPNPTGTPPRCPTSGIVDGLDERKKNFDVVLTAFQLTP